MVAALRKVQEEFNGKQTGKVKVSLADLIVLGGCAAVEKAASDAGVQVAVPFTAGRRDTTQELTDIEMSDWLKPVVDGFRNYTDDKFAEISKGVAPEELFLDKAQLLTLTAPEWVALVGGLRVMGANYDGSSHGIFTDRVGMLTNDFFTVLTSMDYEWKKQDAVGMMFTLDDRATGEPRYKALRSDLVFGSNSQLRAVAEVYASTDGHARLREGLCKGLGQGDDAGPVRRSDLRRFRAGGGDEARGARHVQRHLARRAHPIAPLDTERALIAETRDGSRGIRHTDDVKQTTKLFRRDRENLIKSTECLVRSCLGLFGDLSGAIPILLLHPFKKGLRLWWRGKPRAGWYAVTGFYLCIYLVIGST